MNKIGLADDVIYIDKKSCKDFNRENYQSLNSLIEKDDLLIIKLIN